MRSRRHRCADLRGCANAPPLPDGAASYALPPADALLRKLRALLGGYREAGGKQHWCCSTTTSTAAP